LRGRCAVRCDGSCANSAWKTRRRFLASRRNRAARTSCVWCPGTWLAECCRPTCGWLDGRGGAGRRTDSSQLCRLWLVRTLYLDRGHSGNGVEVGVNMQHGQAPCLRCRRDKQVDNGRSLVLTEIDQVVLNAFDEAPRILGHRVPAEQGPEDTA